MSNSEEARMGFTVMFSKEGAIVKAACPEWSKTIIKEKIIRYATNHGYQLSYDDFESVARDKVELKPEELKAVAGGSSCNVFVVNDCQAIAGDGGRFFA